jgi:hypothetical protein
MTWMASHGQKRFLTFEKPSLIFEKLLVIANGEGRSFLAYTRPATFDFFCPANKKFPSPYTKEHNLRCDRGGRCQYLATLGMRPRLDRHKRPEWYNTGEIVEWEPLA